MIKDTSPLPGPAPLCFIGQCFPDREEQVLPQYIQMRRTWKTTVALGATAMKWTMKYPIENTLYNIFAEEINKPVPIKTRAVRKDNNDLLSCCGLETATKNVLMNRGHTILKQGKLVHQIKLKKIAERKYARPSLSTRWAHGKHHSTLFLLYRSKYRKKQYKVN